ncbi:hypothetical protein [Streptomyces sp. NBC_01190]|uniref:hypothetical protein n=1 Tax=Streptomyces sp. NBC_01190 TaxID=2903767 RepID=UPI00386BE03C|nr:hypothetical protein OG519_20905 [Streptomyces sp. NBC_01190]
MTHPSTALPPTTALTATDLAPHMTTHCGLPVMRWGDEDDTWLTLGHQEPRRALAAFLAHAHATYTAHTLTTRCGPTGGLLREVLHGYAIFTPDEFNDWQAVFSLAPGTPGAIPLTWLCTG